MSNTESNSYEYNDLNQQGKIKISPSSFSKFFESAYHWYKDEILKENNFSGNTATVLGTILHKRIEQYWNGEPVNRDAELMYLDLYKDNPEVDEWKIAEQLDSIWDLLSNGGLMDIPKPDKTEQPVVFNIPNTDYHISGTYDYIRGNTLGDIKTTSSTPKKIKVSHRIQLLLYVLALKHNGVTNIEYIEVFYIVKTKTPKMVVLREPISEDDIEWIKQQVKNMIKRVDMVKEDDSLVDIIFPKNPDTYL